MERAVHGKAVSRPVRSAIRRARRWFVARRTDHTRARQRALIRRSGFFDQTWVELQLGSSYANLDEAVGAYLSCHRRCTPHQLFEPRWLNRGPVRPPKGVNALLWYLQHPTARETMSPHPLIDMKTLRETRPDLRGSEFGPVAAWLAEVGPETPLPTAPDHPGTTWAEVQQSSRRALTTWERTRRLRAESPRTRPSESIDWAAAIRRGRTVGRISVVVPAKGGVHATVDRVRLLASGRNVEVILVGVDLRRGQHLLLQVFAASMDNVELVSLSGSQSGATALNLGFARSTGERVVFATEPCSLDAPALAALTRALDDDRITVSQPVVLGPDDTVASAGAVFATEQVRPRPFLERHPVSDVPSSGAQTLPIPAVMSPVFAVRAIDLAAQRGLDPLCARQWLGTELSLRLHRESGGWSALVPAVSTTSRRPTVPGPEALEATLRLFDERFERSPSGSRECWERAGFEVVATAGDPAMIDAARSPGPHHELLHLPRAIVRPVRASSITERVPSLRWTIDVASPAGSRGNAWGDTHFGAALARALSRLGQVVAVDRREARERTTRDLDDVILVLRGLDRVEPRSGRVNLEWVISHPDLVTPDEIAAFDRVYAASPLWPSAVARRWGLEVHPLLQATDPELFHPGRATFDSGADLLYVGNSRGVFRTSLQNALAIGVEVAVHGAGWEQMLPESMVVSSFVENADLGAMYTSAGVVLNDHWEDMRVNGFISNRLMDAAASGARVVSDSIPGVDLSAMFGGLVQTWDGPTDFARILARRDELFPDDEGRRKAAAQVASEHSFAARAAALLDDAVRLLRERGA